MKTGDLVSLGFVISVHGLKGLVKVKTYSGRADNLSAASFLYIRKVSGEIVRLTVKRVSEQKNFFLLSFCEINSIEEAETLVKGEILKKKNELLPTDEDEYYWEDLLGLYVYSKNGKFLGTISEIIETGANFVIAVTLDKKERLFPFIKTVICDVDITNKKLILDDTGYDYED